jgi:hypothetical protein
VAKTFSPTVVAHLFKVYICPDFSPNFLFFICKIILLILLLPVALNIISVSSIEASFFFH